MDVYDVVFLLSAAVLPAPPGFTAALRLSEFCASSTPQNKCVGVNKTDGYRWACSNGFHEEYYPPVDNSLLHTLMLCHWPMDYFEPVVWLWPYAKISKLTITKSKIKAIVGEFPAFLQNLKTLNLSHLNMEYVELSKFKYLSSLEILDLSHNKLNYLNPPTKEYLPKLKQIWLAGQSWFCNNDLFWLLHVSKDPLSYYKVMDSNRMVCGKNKYTGKPVIPVLRLLDDLETECPSSPPNNCVCTLDNVFRDNKSASINLLHPTITVDCSYRGLKALPKVIPSNTTTLLVQGNQISTLDELLNNRYYTKLLDIYLDYNRITSISMLEGSNWLLQCRIMSFKGNNLTKVPTYALDNAFQLNRNIGQLYLGANPWGCNCLFAPAFQDFLMKYRKLIMDLSDIRCSNDQGDEYNLTPIFDLPRTILCRNPEAGMMDFWGRLNVLLASLIVVIVLKFIYDYLMYKKYSRLPWIVSLIP